MSDKFVEQTSRFRGRPMEANQAIACGSAIAVALGAMYIMKQDVKQKEGQLSPYNNEKRMNSSDVSATVTVPKPGKDRLPP
ncbi:hypothetical protein AMATHDRAFT_6173 [Amanita thiersii Skay4041]|uniref:Uncharacterized protein n=1 Tax=Amanita thiersii Skay4041 TaxID=703135 RepID=A0A2A9NDA4_9AGAR|nr:hypothetical protein AMATHDRAFT_6173 [Amanita thiersii Skay4041]